MIFWIFRGNVIVGLVLRAMVVEKLATTMILCLRFHMVYRGTVVGEEKRWGGDMRPCETHQTLRTPVA